MNKKELIKSASQLKQPSDETVVEFRSKTDEMTRILNDRLTNRKDINQLIGEDNLDMMCDNHRNHMRFMISLFSDYDPGVFTETVLWVFRAYRSHGFKLTYWPAQLDNLVEIFKSELSRECFNEIYPFYNWMIINNPLFAIISDQTILGDSQPDPCRH
jgi:hypothetical protein